ncbi:MAG: uracil-DNA glycosylase [Rhodothermia bacterium]|nr:uracil-DNA glycosylase [Rhodothermia bacterium]
MPETQLTPSTQSEPEAQSGPARQSKPTPIEAKPTSVMQSSVTTAAERFEALIPDDSPLHSLRSLAEVEVWVAESVLIPLDEARLNPVFGVGDPKADLMVIGEAPGAEEDRQGEPFVGRAGQLLNQILEAIGFARSDVYIANILKSRPPNNRDPLPAEIEAHIPILHKQISIIRPRIILCVGKTAGNSLLGRKGSLKSLRGTFHDYHGIPVMVTYHPAALLRNPHWKRPTWEDVQKLRAMFDKLTNGASRPESANG